MLFECDMGLRRTNCLVLTDDKASEDDPVDELAKELRGRVRPLPLTALLLGAEEGRCLD